MRLSLASLAPAWGSLKTKEAQHDERHQLTAADLDQFTGSETWYRHAINRKVLHTEGAQFVAERGGAYWLLDEIAIIQPYDKAIAAEEFQVWKLAVHSDFKARLTCEDGTETPYSRSKSNGQISRSTRSRSGSRITRSICQASTEAPARAGLPAGAG